MTAPDPSEIRAEIQNAYDALADAELLLRENQLKGAISRAYYAVFHAARATLESKALSTKTHKGTLQQFHLRLVKTNKVPEEMGHIISDLHDERDLADYHALTDSFDRIDVEKHVKNARKFVETVEAITSSQ